MGQALEGWLTWSRGHVELILGVALAVAVLAFGGMVVYELAAARAELRAWWHAGVRRRPDRAVLRGGPLDGRVIALEGSTLAVVFPKGPSPEEQAREALRPDRPDAAEAVRPASLRFGGHVYRRTGNVLANGDLVFVYDEVASRPGVTDAPGSESAAQR
jgi:hypothetical protein